MRRRTFIKSAVATTGVTIAANHLAAKEQSPETAVIGTVANEPDAKPVVAIGLLEGKALHFDSEVSFGIPWAKGSGKKGDRFVLGLGG